jgi:2-C-methyl-D-erythritol 4-phosphate cytidylyltransferase
MAADLPKQYLRMGGLTVLEHTLDALLSSARISGVVLALAETDRHWSAISRRYAGHALETVNGGVERCHSVQNCLDHLASRVSDTDQVLVHDAARPCVRAADIERLIDTVTGSEDGGLLGLPVADTMKRVDAGGRIQATVPRERLWRALTPQQFRLGLLRGALRQALDSGALVTDEAAAMELAGYRPRMVQGHGDNIKITVPSDLAVAEFYLQTREST